MCLDSKSINRRGFKVRSPRYTLDYLKLEKALNKENIEIEAVKSKGVIKNRS